jgi:hypothetical protein
MRHTRSPWLAANASGGRIFKRWGVFSGGRRLATMVEGISSSQERDNATVMAAAPELLKALVDLVEHLPEDMWTVHLDRDIRDAAVAAIRKAEGQVVAK